MKNKIFTILNFLIVIFLSCKENEYVAIFKNGYVTFKEAVLEYQNLDIDERKKITTKNDYFRLVRKIALEKIILLKAYEKNLDKDPEIFSDIEKAKKRIAKEVLFYNNIDKKVKIKPEHYKKYRKLYEVYHIVKRTDVPDPKEIEEKKLFLEKLAKEIDNLDTFKKFAQQYSDDITASTGGYIGKIRLGIMEESIDNELQKIELNKVSKVIETSRGFHLLFVTGIEEVPFENLLNDKKLYEEIMKEEKLKEEEKWINTLLKKRELKIYKDKFFNINDNNELIVEYKNKKIYRSDILKTIERYKISSFPEPTKEDIYKLTENMAIDLILNELSLNKKILNSKLFQNKFEREKKLILVNAFIERNIQLNELSKEDLLSFYNNNKNELFSYVDNNGKTVIQPFSEVEKFIEYKMKSNLQQNARYTLYRKMIDEAEFKIEENKLQKLKNYLEKLDK